MKAVLRVPGPHHPHTPQPRKEGSGIVKISAEETGFGNYACLFSLSRTLSRSCLCFWNGKSETYYFKIYLKTKHFLSFTEQAWACVSAKSLSCMLSHSVVC